MRGWDQLAEIIVIHAETCSVKPSLSKSWKGIDNFYFFISFLKEKKRKQKNQPKKTKQNKQDDVQEDKMMIISLAVFSLPEFSLVKLKKQCCCHGLGCMKQKKKSCPYCGNPVHRVNMLLVNLIIFCDKIPQTVNKNCWLNDVLLGKKCFLRDMGWERSCPRKCFGKCLYRWSLVLMHLLQNMVASLLNGNFSGGVLKPLEEGSSPGKNFLCYHILFELGGVLG